MVGGATGGREGKESLFRFSTLGAVLLVFAPGRLTSRLSFSSSPLLSAADAGKDTLRRFRLPSASEVFEVRSMTPTPAASIVGSRTVVDDGD